MEWARDLSSSAIYIAVTNYEGKEKKKWNVMLSFRFSAGIICWTRRASSVPRDPYLTMMPRSYITYIYMLDFVIQGYWQHIFKLYLLFSHRRRACITILLPAKRDESNTITICDCDAIEITTVPSSSPTRHSDFDMLLWRWFYHTFSFFSFFTL